MTVTFAPRTITSGPSTSLNPTYPIETVRTTHAASAMSDPTPGHQS